MIKNGLERLYNENRSERVVCESVCMSMVCVYVCLFIYI